MMCVNLQLKTVQRQFPGALQNMIRHRSRGGAMRGWGENPNLSYRERKSVKPEPDDEAVQRRLAIEASNY